MSAIPLYSPTIAHAAYQLRYAWSAWPSSGEFERQPTELIVSTAAAWESDGLRVLEHRWTEKFVQILFSTPPDAAPILITARAKGRLGHALRQAGIAIDFSRKVALRSIGDNTRRDVEAYVERQVAKEQFADQQFERIMAEFTVVNSDVDLAQPSESARGRYWYNLHLVLVSEGRVGTGDQATLHAIRDGCLRIAINKGHLISRLSVMPDHLHFALRPAIDQSPLDVVSMYQNNLAFLLGQKRIWNESFYVGTFGEYTMQAIRNVVNYAS